MKKLFLSAFIGIQLIINTASAQVTTRSMLSSPGISKTDIAGIWQFGTATVGDNLLEYFQFFKDGTFVYHYNGEDDTRNIISIKGRYFLNKNQLSFIVKSKVERTARGIETGSMCTDE